MDAPSDDGRLLRAESIDARMSADGRSLLLVFRDASGRSATVALGLDEIGALASTLNRLDRTLTDLRAAEDGGPEGPGG